MRILLLALTFMALVVVLPIGVLADPICNNCSLSTCEVQGQYDHWAPIVVYVNLATNNYYYLLIFKPDGSTVREDIGNGPGSFQVTGYAGPLNGVRYVQLWVNGGSQAVASCGSFMVVPEFPQAFITLFMTLALGCLVLSRRKHGLESRKRHSA